MFLVSSQDGSLASLTSQRPYPRSAIAILPFSSGSGALALWTPLTHISAAGK